MVKQLLFLFLGAAAVDGLSLLVPSSSGGGASITLSKGYSTKYVYGKACDRRPSSSPKRVEEAPLAILVQ